MTPINVTIVDKSGMPAPNHIRDLWKSFMEGNWVQGTPGKPGRYLTATSKGRLAGEILAFNKENKLQVVYRASAIDDVSEGYSGWYWSAPFPSVLPAMLPMRQIMRQLMVDRKAREVQESKPKITLVPVEG